MEGWESQRMKRDHAFHPHLKDWLHFSMFNVAELQKLSLLCYINSTSSLHFTVLGSAEHGSWQLQSELWGVQLLRASGSRCWTTGPNLTIFKIWDFFIKKSAYVKCLFFPYLFSGLLLWKIFLKGSTIQTVHHLICLFSKAGWIC